MVADIPIFDMIRSVSMVSVVHLAFRQFFRVWGEIYRDSCPHCRGTGIIVCPHCHGSKVQRRSPAVLVNLEGKKQYVERLGSTYECIFCGDYTNYDADLFYQTVNEELLYEIFEETQAKVADAMQNRQAFRNNLAPLAGTITCTTCQGARRVQLIEFQHRRLFNMDYPIDVKLELRKVDHLSEGFGEASKTLTGPYFEYPRTSHNILYVARKIKPPEQSFVQTLEEFDFEKFQFPYVQSDEEANFQNTKIAFETLKASQDTQIANQKAAEEREKSQQKRRKAQDRKRRKNKFQYDLDKLYSTTNQEGKQIGMEDDEDSDTEASVIAPTKPSEKDLAYQQYKQDIENEQDKGNQKDTQQSQTIMQQTGNDRQNQEKQNKSQNQQIQNQDEDSDDDQDEIKSQKNNQNRFQEVNKQDKNQQQQQQQQNIQKSKNQQDDDDDEDDEDEDDNDNSNNKN